MIDPKVDECRWHSLFMPEPNSGCWLWVGSIMRDEWPYGILSIQGKKWRAHRYSYWKAKGPFDLSMDVLHKCDNPSCVNPDHLFLGNDFANMADCASKKRNGMQRHPERSSFNGSKIKRPSGEGHGRSKLTEAVVSRMREMATSGYSSAEIALEAGISSAHARKVISGKAWAFSRT